MGKVDKASVGIVEQKRLKLELPEEGFKLKNGSILPEITVAYESYGELSAERNNVVCVCHALTGNAHVAGKYKEDDKAFGWWDEMVGPGKGIDTDYYHVICSNILGGCDGTTGPSSINPQTGKPYGSAFPEISVSDIVAVQKLLLDQLGINNLAAVVGGSFGGMQVLEWGVRYPDYVDSCICIAASASLSTQALAFDAVGRDAILSDPGWCDGDYYEHDKAPDWGLAHARKIGHITYLSPEILQHKFGRDTGVQRDAQEDKPRFEIENYLDYQGKKLVDRFDANSYLRITGAMDSYDLISEYGALDQAFKDVDSKFLIIGLSSDWLFPPEQSVEIANALHAAGKHVSCCTLEAPYGHDAFLIDIQHLSDAVRAFLPWVGGDAGKRTADCSPEDETRFNIIVDCVKEGARVLDLGCGNGGLLSVLKNNKQTSGTGIDIDLENLIEALDRGHDVFQGDLDGGLSVIPDQSYDYAVLSGTLQEVRKPKDILHEMLRVAREGIVMFPNFGNWRNRLYFGLRGHMPKSRILPYEWYDTPNIHLSTHKDFFSLCEQEGINVLDRVCIPGAYLLDRMFVGMKQCNLGAEMVLVRISKGAGGEASTSCCRKA